MGVSNIIGSFLQCFVSCASLSRSLVQENAGCITQVNCLFGLFVFFLWFYSIDLFFYF